MKKLLPRHLVCPICQNEISRWRWLFSIRYRKNCLYCKAPLSISAKSHILADICTSIIIAVIIYYGPKKVFIYPNVVVFFIFSILCFWGFMIYFVEVKEQKNGKEYLTYIFYVLIFVLITVSIIGAIFYKLFYKNQQYKLKMPENLKNPQTIVDKTSISKGVFLKKEGLGSITDIKVKPDKTIVIAGTHGAAVLDSSYQITRRINFKGKTASIKIVESDTGRIYFLNKGRCNYCNPSLINWEGEIIWSYSGDTCIFAISYGDVNNDGKSEFVIGFNGEEGIHLINDKGEVLWRIPEHNIWHIEITDINDDGGVEIVHTNASGEIVVRDWRGKIIKKVNKRELGIYISEFSITNWPDKRDKKYLLTAGDNVLWLLSMMDDEIIRLKAPASNSLGESKGVIFNAANLDYFVVLVNYRPWHRSALYIYNEQSELIYAEIMGESCEAIATMEYITNSFLIGCQNKIWEIKFNK